VGSREFDVVADFLSFTPDQVQQQLDQFGGRTGQYVFISSASAYQTPPARLPVTESTPLRNPHWAYSRNKIACEDLLVRAYRDDALPMTIVRPSHTYDHTLPPFSGGWTVVERMRQGREVLVHGDGMSLWTITHHTDFARAFVGLLGRREALGEAFHITGDESPTWNQIYTDIAEAAGVEPRLVHVPSDAVAAVDEDLGASLLGDKAHSMVFDNSRIKSLVPGWTAVVPFRQGAQEIVDWHDEEPSRRTVDARLDALYDRLIDAYRPRSV
jgi:nucleoside-diphosphate-sugar epimerase